MIVYIMRHGEATVDSSRQDAERHLTDLGAAQVKNVLNIAKELGAKVYAIASSPLARARETAEIAARTFGLEFTVSDSLEPEGSPDEVYDELSKHDPLKGLLLVSHQPLVSMLLRDILGEKPKTLFSAGSLAVVKTEGPPKSGSGTLVLFIPSKISIS